MWAPRGSRPAQVKQTEYDWVYLYGAANPQTGDSLAWLAPTVNTDLMNRFLRQLSQHLGRHRYAVLVLDGAGWHVAKQLQVPGNITCLPLPPYSPELNPMERLWAWLKSHHLSNRVYRNYDDLLDIGTTAWNSLTRRRIRSVCHTSWIERRN